jgi:hypothetical protein
MALIHSEKLQALTTIGVRSGILQTDYHDIRKWQVEAGPEFDIGSFSDKTLERIEVLFQQYFQY